MGWTIEGKEGVLFYRSFVLSSPSCNGTVYGQEAIDAFGGGAGLYVAYDSEAKESDPAPYTMVTSDKNQPVLTFCATDSVISNVKADSIYTDINRVGQPE